MKIQHVLGVLIIGAFSALFVLLTLLFMKDTGYVVVETGVVQAAALHAVPLPVEWPSSTPVYPAGSVRSVQEVLQTDEHVMTVTLVTTDTPTQVYDWYCIALQQAPWSLTSNQEVGRFFLIKGRAGSVTLFIQVAPHGEAGGAVITQRVRLPR